MTAKLRTKDRDLARQIKRSSASIALNVAEATGRMAGDRVHLFRIALGSGRETMMALRVAESFGDLTAAQVEPALTILDRLCGMLYRLSR